MWLAYRAVARVPACLSLMGRAWAISRDVGYAVLMQAAHMPSACHGSLRLCGTRHRATCDTADIPFSSACYRACCTSRSPYQYTPHVMALSLFTAWPRGPPTLDSFAREKTGAFSARKIDPSPGEKCPHSHRMLTCASSHASGSARAPPNVVTEAMAVLSYRLNASGVPWGFALYAQ